MGEWETPSMREEASERWAGCGNPSVEWKMELLSGYGNEDLDHAIVLSLSEEELKKPISIGTVSNADEDEQLARALQESLNTKSPPSENGKSPRVCAGCGNKIGHEKFLSLVDALWHPECFCCFACDQTIYGYDYYIYEDHPYHMSCYKNLYHPKCDVCKEFVPTRTNGKPIYDTLGFWMQKSCISHEHDGTRHCFCCRRREPQGANYSRLDDRMVICQECLNSSIMDIDECQPLYLDIQIFYKSFNMEVHREVMLFLVESGVLLSKAQPKKGFPPPDNIVGLCQINKQTDQTNLKQPKISIFITKGLPRIMTGVTLAHEMMHAWLRLNGYPRGTLDPYVEEGICTVMSYMWLGMEMLSGSDSNVASSSSSSSSTSYRKGLRSQYERKFGEYYKCALENKVCPIYGDGFRAGHAAVLKYGLKNVLDHIKLTGKFPR